MTACKQTQKENNTRRYHRGNGKERNNKGASWNTSEMTDKTMQGVRNTDQRVEEGRKACSLVIFEASRVGLGALAASALVAAGVALALALEATPHPHLRVCNDTRWSKEPSKAIEWSED